MQTLLKKEYSKDYITILLLRHYTFQPEDVNAFKGCIMTLLDSKMNAKDKRWWNRSIRAVHSMRTAFLKAFNSMVAAIQEMYPASALSISLSENRRARS